MLITVTAAVIDTFSLWITGPGIAVILQHVVCSIKLTRDACFLKAFQHDIGRHRTPCCGYPPAHQLSAPFLLATGHLCRHTWCSFLIYTDMLGGMSNLNGIWLTLPICENKQLFNLCFSIMWRWNATTFNLKSERSCWQSVVLLRRGRPFHFIKRVIHPPLALKVVTGTHLVVAIRRASNWSISTDAAHPLFVICSKYSNRSSSTARYLPRFGTRNDFLVNSCPFCFLQ